MSWISELAMAVTMMATLLAAGVLAAATGHSGRSRMNGADGSTRNDEVTFDRRRLGARILRASRRLIALTALTALLALGGVANTTDKAIAEDDLVPTVSTATDSDVVVDWSRIVVEAAMTDDGFVSFMGSRHQAMMHIAMTTR